MLSRRDLLRSALTATAATAACRRPPGPKPPLFAGEFVDSHLTAGHLLRGPPLPVANVAPRPVDVLIIGGGVAGLSAAWRLASAGVRDFLVCELCDEAGGTSRSGKSPVSAFPWGAHYLPAPFEAQGPVPRLLGEMGVLKGVDAEGHPELAEEVLVHEPEERVFYRGSWYEGLYLRAGASPEDLAELARFTKQMDGFAALRDGKGRKAFNVPLALGSDDAQLTALDAVSMAQWLSAQGYRSPRLRWFVDYACRDDFGTTAEHTSAYAGIWYFAARHDGSGRRAEGYLSWPEGNGALVKALLRAAGPARLAPSVLVTALTPDPGGCDVQALDVRTREPLRFRARQVVLAVPTFIAARLLAGAGPRPAFVDDFHYGPWVVANIHLSAPPASRGFPLAWDNVLYESQSLGYVVSTHQTLRQAAGGPTVLTWYYPLVGPDVRAERAQLLESTLAQWHDAVLADLAVAHPGFKSLITRVDVCRWGHAMIRPRPGFLFGASRQAAQHSVAGVIHPAHTDLGGMALFEEANAFGVQAAERALAGLGRPVTAWL